METVVKKDIMPGVDLTCVHTDKFKTGNLSITLMTELNKQTVSKTALLCGAEAGYNILPHHGGHRSPAGRALRREDRPNHPQKGRGGVHRLYSSSPTIILWTAGTF